MTIICDSREQKWSHVRDYFDVMRVKWIRSKLPVGDYARMDNLSTVIDRKAGLNEVESNLIHDHERFRRECQLAQDNGIHLIVLVESGSSVKELRDVYGWRNPRRVWWDKVDRAHSRGRMLEVKIPSKPPTEGPTLYKVMRTMAERYGVEWRFCVHQDAGKTICRILEGLQPQSKIE
jgi:ribosome-associated protein